MSRTLPLGTHHSHFQPRHPDGTFVSYEELGRRLSGQALAHITGIVVNDHTIGAAPHGSCRRAAPLLLPTWPNAQHR